MNWIHIVGASLKDFPPLPLPPPPPPQQLGLNLEELRTESATPAGGFRRFQTHPRDSRESGDSWNLL